MTATEGHDWEAGPTGLGGLGTAFSSPSSNPTGSSVTYPVSFFLTGNLQQQVDDNSLLSWRNGSDTPSSSLLCIPISVS